MKPHVLKNHPELVEWWTTARELLISYMNDGDKDKHEAAWSVAMTLMDELTALRLSQLASAGNQPDQVRAELERTIKAHRQNIALLVAPYTELNGIPNPFDTNAQVRHEIMKDAGL